MIAVADSDIGFEFVTPRETAFTPAPGEIYLITPLRVRDVGPFAQAVAPLLDWAPALLAGELEDNALLANVMAEGAEHLLRAVAIASRIPAERIGELGLDQLAALVALCVEANADFFRRALPALAAAGARIKAALPQAAASAGATPSSN